MIDMVDSENPLVAWGRHAGNAAIATIAKLRPTASSEPLIRQIIRRANEYVGCIVQDESARTVSTDHYCGTTDPHRMVAVLRK